MKREMNFDNFHVYEGNKVAFLAIQKIIEFPGELFNPLYVHGGTGLGKTHLLWAFHTVMVEKGKVLFFTGKDFELQLKQGTVFEHPLIVDDIHLIDPSCHDKFVNTIDTFLSGNIQLCFSGNAAPRELKNFSDKLLSRLEGGLVCDIVPPKEMALIELIKKKSGESGILLPDDVALELAQISTGSIRAIEGMINRLVAYSSLGNMTLDVNAVHMILKEFYPKGVYSPVSSLLEELKKNASEVLQDVSSKLDVREEYREKIYVWQMKGFDTSSLAMLLDGDVDVLKREYDTFIKKVEQLIELQKRYGALDLTDKPDEAMKIESMLFSPEKADEVEQLIDSLAVIKVEIDPTKTFDTMIIGKSNERAVDIYKKQIKVQVGEKYNPMVIFGALGVGKTRLLEAIYNDLIVENKKVIYHDFATRGGSSTLPALEEGTIVLCDNFHAVFKAPETVQLDVLKFLQDAVAKNIGVIMCTEHFPETVVLAPDQKQMFELGIEAELDAPDATMVIEYIEPRLTPMQYEQLVAQGIPDFPNFLEVEQYIASVTTAPQEIVPLDEIEESKEPEALKPAVSDTPVVALGFPGEEAAEKGPKEQETEAAEETVVSLGLPGEQLETHEPEPDQETSSEDLVTLGLPGEEIEEKVVPQEQEKIDEGDEQTLGPEIREPLKKIHEERFIIQEIPNELIEDNY